MVTLGTSSCNNSRFLVSKRVNIGATPVTLPTGRLMLDTNPDLIGSLPLKKTIGIVCVAAFAARAAGRKLSGNDCDVIRYQFCRKRGQSIILTVSSTIFDADRLNIDTGLAQTSFESIRIE